MSQFLGLMLDPFVDGRRQLWRQRRHRLRAGASRRTCRPISRSLTPRSSPRRRRHPSISAGPPGARLTAAATAPMAMRPSARATSPREPLALPPAWIITSRPTPSSALRSPAAAPIGARQRARHWPQRRAAGRRLWHHLCRAGLFCRRARLHRSLVHDKSLALGDQLNANFDGQSYGVRLESGYRVARAADAGRDTLRRAAGAGFPHARLQRDPMSGAAASGCPTPR